MLLFLVTLWFASHYGRPTVEEVSYSEFKQMLRAGRVSEVVLGETEVEGQSLSTQGAPSQRYRAVRVEDPDLVKELEAAKVPYRGKLQSQWGAFALTWLIPLLIFVLIWRWVLRRSGGAQRGLLAIGQSKAKVHVDRDTGVWVDEQAWSAVRFPSVGGGVWAGPAVLEEIMEERTKQVELGTISGDPGAEGDVRTFLDGSTRAHVVLRSAAIGLGTYRPGWRWSLHAGPQTGKAAENHIGYVISGRMMVRDAVGREVEIPPGSAFEVGPGADAWVAGDTPCVAIDFIPIRR